METHQQAESAFGNRILIEYLFLFGLVFQHHSVKCFAPIQDTVAWNFLQKVE
jgi:hypothetical protein